MYMYVKKLCKHFSSSTITHDEISTGKNNTIFLSKHIHFFNRVQVNKSLWRTFFWLHFNFSEWVWRFCKDSCAKFYVSAAVFWAVHLLSPLTMQALNFCTTCSRVSEESLVTWSTYVCVQVNVPCLPEKQAWRYCGIPCFRDCQFFAYSYM